MSFKLRRDDRGAIRVEHLVLCAAVTMTLALPFATFGRLSSGRFVAVESDETRWIVPPRAGTENEASEPIAPSDEMTALAAEEDGWAFLTRRTLSRLIWLAAENFIVTRDLGRWHAERTGQVQSYEAFVAAARRNIRESWEGLRTIVETLPAQVVDDPSKVPMLAGAMVVGAVTSVLYPFQAAGALVFGSDDEAGAVAGGFIIDAWTTKALAVAGIGTRALRGQRIARIWNRFVQRGHELTAAFVPRPRAFAHAPASVRAPARAYAHPYAPARASARANTRAMSSGGGGLSSKQRELLLVRQDLFDLGFSDDVVRIATTSPTLRRILNEARALRHSADRLAPWENAALRPSDPILGVHPELLHLARVVSASGSMGYLGRTFRPLGAPPPLLHEYLLDELPHVARGVGKGELIAIEVWRELGRASPSLREQLDLAFRVGNRERQVFSAFQKHGTREIAEAELGLLHVHDHAAYYVRELARKYNEQRFAGSSSRAASLLQRRDYDLATSDIYMQLRVAYTLRGEKLPPARQWSASDTFPGAELVGLGREASVVLRNARIDDRTAQVAARSNMLLADLRRLSTTNWNIMDSTRVVSVVPGAIGLPGFIWLTGAGYERIATLARRAGSATARYRAREILWQRPMTREEYVDANAHEAVLREANGMLRSLEIRDELLHELPEHATEIHRAFLVTPDVEKIYREYLTAVESRARGARILPVDSAARRRAQEAIAELPLGWPQFEKYYELLYASRRAQMERWAWW